MARVIQKLRLKGFLETSWRGRRRIGHDAYTLTSRYKSVARGPLSYYGPCRNIMQLLQFVKGDHALCRAISMVTGVPNEDIIKRFSGYLNGYKEGVDQVVETI